VEIHLLPQPRARRLTVFAVGLVVIAIVAVGAYLGFRLTEQPTQRATTLAPATANSSQPVPAFSHVFTIVLENKSASSVLGSPDAPYLNELAGRYGVAQSYQGVAHPSQPNYLALFSGSTQGITDDQPHDITAPTIADQLEATGRSWRVYAEDVPGGCFNGATASSGGVDGSGTYARKHEPAISFTAISGSPSRCANVRPLRDFDPTASSYALIIPNMCNDAHDCPLSTADAWLKSYVPRILDSPAWQDGGVLFITFDEADGPERNANLVSTLVIAPNVAPGTQSSVPHSHYSLLRTIQAGFGLDCLAETCQANTLGEFFR
jgi:phosphatidylinositol-3-phosphatase